MITTAELQSLSLKNLAAMARDFDIAGRSAMTRDDLIAAIRKAKESSRKKLSAKKPAENKKPGEKSKKNGGPRPAAGGSIAKAKQRPARTARASGSSSREAASSKAPAGSKAAASVAGSPGTAVAAGRAKGSAAGGPKGSASAAKSTRGLTAVKANRAVISAVKPASGKRSASAAEKSGSAAAAKKPAARSGSPASTKHPAAKLPAAKAPSAPAPVSAKSRRIREEMRRRSQQAMQNKDLSTGILVAGSAIRGSSGESEHTPHKDRVTLIVRDSFWLQADWEVTRAAVQRVRVAMNEKWHNAQPVLRLMSVGEASSNRAEQLLRDIPIHGGVNSWFIDVDSPPSRFRVVVGYLAENDRFYPLCRSNIVETPKPDAVHRLDRQWRDIAEDYERIYSLSGGYDVNCSGDLREVFEQRLQRQMPNRKDDSLGSDTDAALDRHRALPFEVDAELIIYGSTIPGATVMLSGEPVKLRSDGTFTVRVALPDKRQVLPVIAQSRDSMKQRTTVIAVERNTKVMEAVDRDQNF